MAFTRNGGSNTRLEPHCRNDFSSVTRTGGEHGFHSEHDVSTKNEIRILKNRFSDRAFSLAESDLGKTTKHEREFQRNLRVIAKDDRLGCENRALNVTQC